MTKNSFIYYIYIYIKQQTIIYIHMFFFPTSFLNISASLKDVTNRKLERSQGVKWRHFIILVKFCFSKIDLAFLSVKQFKPKYHKPLETELRKDIQIFDEFEILTFIHIWLRDFLKNSEYSESECLSQDICPL